ncbi:MAG: 30S ribosomal protein S16 [Chloroflexota bacterium]|nr:30S ribosomal protein S16 [Chloroflexota bacterium]
MVRIRLRRVGLKGQPSYRIVIADQRASRNGGFIEAIGFHNPRTQPSTDLIQEDRVLHWLSVGAQPSEAVVPILRRTGSLERYERLKKGEKLEDLLAEAEKLRAAAPPVSPRTRYPSPGPGEGRGKKQGGQ